MVLLFSVIAVLPIIVCKPLFGYAIEEDTLNVMDKLSLSSENVDGTFQVFILWSSYCCYVRFHFDVQIQQIGLMHM